MKNFLMAAGTAVLLSNFAIAPAFADSLSSEIEPETQNQIVLPEGEMMTDAPEGEMMTDAPEGEMMTDAELAEVWGSFGGLTGGMNGAGWYNW